MPGKIVNKLRVLLAQKSEEARKNIPLREVERQTKIPWTSLQSWANNKIVRFDAKSIIALCDYLDCEVGDLLIYHREEPD